MNNPNGMKTHLNHIGEAVGEKVGREKKGAAPTLVIKREHLIIRDGAYTELGRTR